MGKKTLLLERCLRYFTRPLFHLLKCQSSYAAPERRVATGVSRSLEKAGFRTRIFVKFHKKSIAGLPGDFDGPSGWVLLIRALRTRSAAPEGPGTPSVDGGKNPKHPTRPRVSVGVEGCGSYSEALGCVAAHVVAAGHKSSKSTLGGLRARPMESRML